jgi:hypothetical protein
MRAAGGRNRRANDTHIIARRATISSCCGQGGGLESISGLWSSPQRWYHYKQTPHINTTFTTNTSRSLHGKHMWWAKTSPGVDVHIQKTTVHKQQCSTNLSFIQNVMILLKMWNVPQQFGTFLCFKENLRIHKYFKNKDISNSQQCRRHGNSYSSCITVYCFVRFV